MTRRRDLRARLGRRPLAGVAAPPSPLADPITPGELGPCVLLLASARGTAADRAALALAGAVASATGRPLAALTLGGEGDWLRSSADATGAIGEPEVASAIALFNQKALILPDEGALGHLGRRVAAERGLALAPRTVALDGPDAVTATNLHGQEARVSAPQVLLAEARFAAPAPRPADRRCRPLVLSPLVPVPDGVTEVAVIEPDAATLALPDASFVAAAGAGVDDLALFARFAAALGATPAASRVLVDRGLVERGRQVGASGHTVVADTYVAIGISGAIQHLEGIAACRRVIAVNTDPSCPMVARADLTLVVDAGDFMRAVLDRLGEHGGRSATSPISAGVGAKGR